ncbi:sulfatase [Flagellimonas sp.]|uniref:sulfatase family protein n=1 Tax=Flagellimonas sp. TaxID=2058762 RepID=UPI003BAD28E5
MEKELITIAICLFLINGCKEIQPKDSKTNQIKNVVLILTDDQGGHISAMGTKGISTPNIDALAEDGILFTNSFAVVPSCSPSRSSIMSGMYPHTNGHWRNTITPTLTDPDVEFGRESSIVDKVGIHEYISTLPEILQEEGYYTAITQKFHMSPPWKFPYSSRNSVSNDPSGYKKAMKSFVKEANGNPFFIQANISPPHRNLDHHMDKFPRFLPEIDSIEVPAYLPDTPKMREDLVKYYGSVQLADACVGSIVETLEELELLDDTLVIFTSDQGEPYHRAKASPYYAGLHVPFVAKGPGVQKDEISEALISHIDIMPTILDFLNIQIPATVQGKSLKKIFTGDMEKLPARDFVFGEHNSHGPIRDEHYPSRAVFDGRYYYIKNLMADKTYLLPADLREEQGWGNRSYDATIEAKESHPTQYKALRTLENGRPTEELYDMANDPGQLINLASKEQYSQKLKEFRNALKNWRVETGDNHNDPIEIPTRKL